MFLQIRYHGHVIIRDISIKCIEINCGARRAQPAVLCGPCDQCVATEPTQSGGLGPPRDGGSPRHSFDGVITSKANVKGYFFIDFIESKTGVRRFVRSDAASCNVSVNTLFCFRFCFSSHRTSDRGVSRLIFLRFDNRCVPLTPFVPSAFQNDDLDGDFQGQVNILYL